VPNEGGRPAKGGCQRKRVNVWKKSGKPPGPTLGGGGTKRGGGGGGLSRIGGTALWKSELCKTRKTGAANRARGPRVAGGEKGPKQKFSYFFQIKRA